MSVFAHPHNINDVTVQKRAHPLRPLGKESYEVPDMSAHCWAMEHQAVKTNEESGIVHLANYYAIETMSDPLCPFVLFFRAITVSMETMRMVRSLPALDMD